MAKYTYTTATGPVEIDVDENWAALLTSEDDGEQNEDRRHTRPDHKYAPGAPLSFDSMAYEGEWIADRRDVIGEAELMLDLEHALQSLTKLQRRCFVLNNFDGLSYAEIARLDGISEAAVRKHIKLGVKKLKKYF